MDLIHGHRRVRALFTIGMIAASSARLRLFCSALSLARTLYSRDKAPLRVCALSSGLMTNLPRFDSSAGRERRPTKGRKKTGFTVADLRIVLLGSSRNARHEPERKDNPVVNAVIECSRRQRICNGDE